MDQLIKALDEKINSLIQELSSAHKEIARLKEGKNTSLAKPSPSDSTLDLLSSMSKRSTEEQLQLYIEDSLDLLEPKSSISPSSDVEHQLHFDLLNQEFKAQPTEDNETTKESPMTTEQTPISTADNQETAATDVEQTQTTSTPSEAPEKAALSAEEKRRQKNQKNNRRLIRMLEERYPKAFDWNNPRPLKVGIDKDMELDDNFNASKQKRAMAAYTRSDRYKKCLLSGQPRIDLEGNAVSDEPALPNAKKPQDAAPKKTGFKGKPKRPQSSGANKGGNNKPTGNNRPTKAKAQPAKEDPQFENLNAEERMQAKLAQLLNKK